MVLRGSSITILYDMLNKKQIFNNSIWNQSRIVQLNGSCTSWSLHLTSDFQVDISHQEYCFSRGRGFYFHHCSASDDVCSAILLSGNVIITFANGNHQHLYLNWRKVFTYTLWWRHVKIIKAVFDIFKNAQLLRWAMTVPFYWERALVKLEGLRTGDETAKTILR